MTVILPWTAFGLFSALSGETLTNNSNPDLKKIIWSIPRTTFWMWLNILAFTISNQSLPDSITEDRINKSWRPLPSGRLTILEARQILLLTIPILIAYSFYLEIGIFALGGLVLTWMYNDLGGADMHFITRNLINALGLTCWSAGSTLAASGTRDIDFNTTGRLWLAIDALIIFTTLHTMDLRDQAGDRARNRRTVPLVLGERFARWSIAIFVLFWSSACAIFWSLRTYHSLLLESIGMILAARVVLLQSVEADKKSWKVWGFWVASLFLSPLLKTADVEPSNSYGL